MITSTSNPQVKHLQQLLKRAKTRKEEDVFLVEGMKLFREAPKEQIRKVYIAKSLYEEQGRGFLCGLEAEILADHVFAAVSGTRTPQGILCILDQYHYTLDDMMERAAPHLLILEDLQDPGNLGTILRTAEGAGVDGVILSRTAVDLYNPKVIRATMGSVYRMPFLYADDLPETVRTLKQKGVCIYAAHLEGKNCYDQEDYRTGCAFLIGNEGNGLSEELSREADIRIRIPMHGQLESLNAAVAASILMYEVCRQRR